MARSALQSLPLLSRNWTPMPAWPRLARSAWTAFCLWMQTPKGHPTFPPLFASYPGEISVAIQCKELHYSASLASACSHAESCLFLVHAESIRSTADHKHQSCFPDWMSSVQLPPKVWQRQAQLVRIAYALRSPTLQGPFNPSAATFPNMSPGQV